MEDGDKQGRTNYDWVNGMRVGFLVGAIVGFIVGWGLNIFPFLLMVIGAGVGGYLGAKMANRW